ncbi:MAG: heme synthase [Bacteroidota bacterium]|jgi:cytochrome c oxidase assembly protein subunit 15|nr:heme synthase [Bacteroidota bacterium]
MMDSQPIQRFIRLAQLTLIFVYLVIIAGSVVRATGSGMGCPDWPKCFGSWVPPTDVSQLPSNYKELYAGEHHAVAEFNALNTWVEYVNRLCGAILGVLIFVQFILSFKFRKTDKLIFTLSFLELILIGFQGWLGAKVVSSNLAPVKITIHMIFALIILAIAITIIQRAKTLNAEIQETNSDRSTRNLGLVVLALTVIQIMIGTQVREEVDILVKNFDAVFRDQIIDKLGISFKIHRTFSLIVMALNGWLVYKLLKSNATQILKSKAQLLIGSLICAFAAGVILAYFALPPVFQPIHFLLACIAFGLQYVIILRLWKKA